MIEPRPYKRRDTAKTICVADTETDPFALVDGEAVAVKPFTVGFYDGSIYVDFWGDDCIQQFFDYLHTRRDEALLIYMHYGGGFDFNFFFDYWDEWSTPRIRENRIASAFFGGHEFRDSWRLIPCALEENHKLAIDYENFVREKREHHKRSIREYQKVDCLSLYSLVSEYHVLFGERETIGSTSLPYLRSFHGFETLNETEDERFRQYYLGGRCQCFETGIIDPPPGYTIDVYDVNSMYLKAMRDFEHPVGRDFDLVSDIGPDTVFACIEADNFGALGMRKDDGSLDFTVESGIFYASIHEINAGLETGSLNIRRVKHAWNSSQRSTFEKFVDFSHGSRLQSKADGNTVRAILYKYFGNSGYGKFAQDSRKYEEYIVNFGALPDKESGGIYHADNNPNGWYAKVSCDQYTIWARPSPNRLRGFKNVATAASITGAARSILLRGLQSVGCPIYCDTDSIMAVTTQHINLDMDPDRLGAWKLEASATRGAILGKKLYGLFGSEKPAPGKEPDKWKPEYCEGRWLIKRACKGGRLSGKELLDVARGGVIEYRNPVPHFRLDGGFETITRTFRKTGAAVNG